ncbi:hypothetical protein AL036_06330 [Salipiger aestuarii]|uniref:TadE-like protein n=1 Tax=Salipiger aestuarii TaxID=568098 RepID=A0A327YDA5_9RHOB|nr:hypothetical protein [Salipiger aestuarii]EIE53103.1 hypothetical protein C357_00574 [Citreicella sp. 357]KAA8608714.1 hypothetical protein AL036_06330 [Salipiger aestuarii]KAA8613053.1 hypothetical protein AL037_05940 [Salipiger aestuarii]KAB2542523.1 hypothetical protein AL035_06415 [Salipiger aestuarii]RAK18993.1 hypothetical protein ATI53_101035 [Salipiger aestuarii]
MKHVVLNALRRFRDSEEGTAVVSVALWAPFMVSIALSTVEMGALTMRQVSLERALDKTIREVKLETGRTWTHAQMKTDICDRATVLTNCDHLLHLEMLSVDMRDYVAPNPQAECTDTVKLLTSENSDGIEIPLSDRLTAQRNFENGQAHQTMVLRACYKYKPISPLSYFGGAIPKDEKGFTAVVSTGLFVHEPQ